MKLRKEFDSIGNINVPDDKYWGASTQRSNKFFNIGKILVDISIIKSIAIIKRSAALVHFKEKQINKKITISIIRASEEIIKGKLDENFPLKVWQTGSGTQTNMNVNEVIANRAIEIMGGKKGTKKPVHPNDHVNKSQSTNDVFPTAMHISIAQETINKLLPNLKILEKKLNKKAKEFKTIIKIGRTHLQDATPLSLGQEFSGYQVQLKKCIERIELSLKEIYFLAQTIVTASHWVGLTFPGIIDEPGSFSGSVNSPYPALGPEPKNLISFEIFIKATAQVFNVPEKLTIESWAANSANLFFAGLKGTFVYLAISLIIFLSKPFFELIPVPTAVPPCARKYISLRACSILSIHFFNWTW